MGTAVFRASTKGYRRVAGKLSAAGRIVQPTILAEFRGSLSGKALEHARGFAPEESGALHEGMSAPVSSRGGTVVVNIRSSVRDPESGYAYTGVTRFGHRKKFIVPRRAKVLSFEWNGQHIISRRVRGQTRASDWVADAAPGIADLTEQAGNNIGRVIVSRIL